MAQLSQPEKTEKTQRIVELDALRALAAINLLLFHFTHVYHVKYGYTSPLGWEFPYGKYGVQLFFMLSGFVNAMTLLRKRTPSDFLAARIIRIFPAFWMVLVVNAILFTVAPLAANGISWDQWLANLTVMPNIFGYECIEPVTWTLQIELLFYGIILFLFVTKLLERPLIATLGAMSLSLLVGLTVKYEWLAGYATAQHWVNSLENVLIIKYLPLFFVGILLNEIKNKRGLLSQNIAGIVVCSIVFHLIDDHGHNPVMTIGLTGLLALSCFGLVPLLRLKPLVFISTISYSLYLMHNNLGTTFIYHLNQNGIGSWLSMIIATVLVIIVSTFSTYCIELPMSNWLKQKWMAWKSSRQATAQPSLNEAAAAS